ncbi:MAG: hypothetical protein ABIG87_01670 [Patescibacteria group bacterium]
MNYITIIIIAIISFVLGRKSVEKAKNFSPKSVDELEGMRVVAKKSLDERTERRKEKILELMNSEAIHQKEFGVCDLVDRNPGITCNDVEKLLEVSGGTARKYLNELEKEEKIEQVGNSGKNVYYILK